MKINGQTLNRNYYDFYTNEDESVVIEKHFDTWRASVTNDEYKENCVFYCEGSFAYCKQQLRKYFGEMK